MSDVQNLRIRIKKRKSARVATHKAANYSMEGLKQMFELSEAAHAETTGEIKISTSPLSYLLPANSPNKLRRF